MGYGVYEPTMYSSHNDFGMFIAGVLFTLLITAVLLGIAALMRKNGHAGAAASNDLTEIVKRRYANGEITKQEYEQLLADLSPAASTTVKNKR